MPKPRKNTKIKSLHGTYRNDRDGHAPEERNMDYRPEPPEYLEETGRDIFEKSVNRLMQWGVLSETDLSQLEIYAQLHDRLKSANDHIEEHGAVVAHVNSVNKIYYQKNPSVTIANDCIDRIRKYATAFGFSPADRSRVSVSEKNKSGLKKLMSGE